MSLFLFTLLVCSGTAFAQTAPPANAPPATTGGSHSNPGANPGASPDNGGGGGGIGGACTQIEESCVKHGYADNDDRRGKGIYMNCLCPLVTPNFPQTDPNIISTLNDPSLIDTCRKQTPAKRIMSMCAQLLANKTKSKHK